MMTTTWQRANTKDISLLQTRIGQAARWAVMAILCSLCLLAQAFNAEEFWREPTKLPFNVVVLEKGVDAGVVWQAMVYTSEIRNGEPMRIFAYYARPAAKGKYPGVVDIHGGGGGASLDGAKAFAKAGYACLSYDWNTTQDPKINWKPGEPLPAKKYTVFGNIRYDDYGGSFVQLGADGKDSVLYRSVIAARRGLTWLSQQREVDAKKLVIEGHSWGGFTTQLVAGIDPRVKAAVSSAAAGAWAGRYQLGLEGHVKSHTPWNFFQWSRRYDPAAFADGMTAPILIRLATTDFFGSIDTLADYWPTIPGEKSLELLPASNHTFGDVETRVAWFDHWLKGGPAFPTITAVELTPGDAGKWVVRVQATGPAAMTKATVSWTTSPGAWNAREWGQLALKQNGAAWETEFSPVNAGGPLRVFVSVRDANGRVVSSMPIIRPLPKPTAQLPTNLTESNVAIVRSAASPITTPTEWKRARTVGPMANGPEVLGNKSADMNVLWDADALYLRLRVDDSSPWALRPANANNWWDADSIQLRLRTDEKANEKLTPTAQVIHLGWYPDATAPGGVRVDAVRGADFKGPVNDISPVTTTVELQDGAGYTLITRIPWVFIDPAFDPRAGRILRFALLVNYGDYLISERSGGIDFNNGGAFNNPDAWGKATLTNE